jgi:uncharacterized protein (TIGR02270 family)
MSTRATFIVDLFDEHLDELGFLWGQWREALRSPEYTFRALAHLEGRIRGHLQGVLVPGEQARPRLREALEGTDGDAIFASGYAALHGNFRDLTEKLLDGLGVLEDDALGALKLALSYGPMPPGGVERLRTMLSARPATRAVVAAEVLAFHRALDMTGDQLRYFVDDEDVTVRLAGWRLAALLGVPLAPNTYSAALRDAEPRVGLAALEAGAWCGLPGVPPVLRQLDDPGRPDRLDALRLLAALGTAEDAGRIQNALADVSLGPERFALASICGAPALMPAVLRALEDPDAATAAAAGFAFARLTGVGIDSDERAVISGGNEEPDAFEKEFQDEVNLPDPPRARREWEQLRPRLEPAHRINRGVDVEQIRSAEGMLAIDMEARRDLFMRLTFRGQGRWTMLNLELFPQGPPIASGQKNAG